MSKHPEYTVDLCNICMVENPATGQVLVQDKVGSWAGITFPGGHIDPGESFTESTIREIREETGLAIANLDLLGVVHWSNAASLTKFCVFLYRSQTFTGTLVDETEEGKVFWMSKEDLLALEEPRTTPHFSTYLDIFLGGKQEAYAQWGDLDSDTTPFTLF